MQRSWFHDSTKFVCVDRAQTNRSTIFRNSEIQSSKYIVAIADDLQGAGVRLEMMPTCFVSKLLLYLLYDPVSRPGLRIVFQMLAIILTTLSGIFFYIKILINQVKLFYLVFINIHRG